MQERQFAAAGGGVASIANAASDCRRSFYGAGMIGVPIGLGFSGSGMSWFG